MSLLRGAFNLRRFLALGPVPDEAELQKGLEKHRFRSFRDETEEERCGWCDWRNPLIVPPDPDSMGLERFALFALRIDTRKVPPTLLKATVDLRATRLMKEKKLQVIGKEARISLQDEVKAELIAKVLPTPKVVEVAWDRKGGVLWTTASSGHTQGKLSEFMHKSFGVELQPLAPLALAAHLAPTLSVETLLSLGPLDLELEEDEA